MVRAIVYISAVVAALFASVSAAPTCGSACDGDDALIDVDVDDYIGVGDIDAEGLGEHLISADDLHIHDLIQNVDILSDGSDFELSAPRPIRRPDVEYGHVCNDGCHHSGGLLGGSILKREEAASPAPKMMTNKKMMKKMMKKKN